MILNRKCYPRRVVLSGRDCHPPPFPAKHLTLSVVTLGFQTMEHTSGILWEETRDDAEYYTRQMTTPNIDNYLAQDTSMEMKA